VGLSSREACGNTVRNVTGDPWGGVADDEVFDATPYAGAFVRYFVRNPLTQLLPRKFKVSFSGSDTDRVIGEIHDLAFYSATRMVDGKEERGFRMLTGGGLSIMPKHAFELYDFVPLSDYLRVSEAVLRIFNRSDELRRNRAKARIKFLVHRVGIETFREMVEAELTGAWAERDYPLDDLVFIDREEIDAPDLPAEAPAIAEEYADLFQRFCATNVKAQVQAGYSTIEVKVNQGDLSPEQFRGLAEILRTYGASRARTTHWQNIVLRWIPDNSVYPVWRELRALGLGNPGAYEINDVVSCPGTDSCKLGITSSMGLNKAIQAQVEEMHIKDPLTRQILINMSGCPNSCGMHHVGNIGFHGAAMKGPGGVQLPAYEMFLGGNYGDKRHEDTRFGQRLPGVKVPAKRVPQVIKDIAGFYKENRQDGEEFNRFLDRVGTKPIEEIAGRYKEVAPLGPDSTDLYMDWAKTDIYRLERGEGECAI
jgi:sulfite reductase beta subunit-like hemoprotein